MPERGITEPEVVGVLTTGWHEKRKDQWKDEYQDWAYSIRGKGDEDRRLRVVVAFDDASQVFVITAIDLDLDSED